MKVKNTSRMLLYISTVLFAFQNIGHCYFDIEGQVIIEREQNIGQKHYKTEASIFMPLFELNNIMLFTDIRGGLKPSNDKNGKWGSAGFGARYNFRDIHVFGAYTFYDYYLSLNGNTFKQMNCGFEALFEKFEARVNSYFPLGKKIYRTGLKNYNESSAFIEGKFLQETALKGFDAEVGYNIGNTGLSVYGGGYYLFSDDFSAIKGPRIRAKFSKSISDFGTLNIFGLFQNDQKRGRQFNFGANFTIPFGSAKAYNTLLAKKVERISGITTISQFKVEDNIVSGINLYDKSVEQQGGQQLADQQQGDQQQGGQQSADQQQGDQQPTMQSGDRQDTDHE